MSDNGVKLLIVSFSQTMTLCESQGYTKVLGKLWLESFNNSIIELLSLLSFEFW